MALLQKAGQFYSSLTGYRCVLHFQAVQKQGSQTQTVEQTYELVLQRPNLLLLKPVTEQQPLTEGIVLASDGTNLLTYIPAAHRYEIKKAPSQIDGLPGRSAQQFASQTPLLGLVDTLLRKDIAATLAEGVTQSTLLGTEEIGSIKATHAHYVQKDLFWDMWIATGQKPWILKTVLDMSPLIEQVAQEAESQGNTNAAAQIRQNSLVMTFLMTNWQANPRLPSSFFAFVPPTNAQQVVSLVKVQPWEELIGQPAPKFQLNLLDGGQLDLAQLLGKKVIVLDFWATWCPPCRRALPLVAQATAKFQNKGVVFYAVNLRETATQIRSFLKQQHLNIPVALDTSGQVAQLYKVTSIPHTVLIGKDGKIAEIHVGFTPNIQQVLEAQLTKLTSTSPSQPPTP